MATWQVKVNVRDSEKILDSENIIGAHQRYARAHEIQQEAQASVEAKDGKWGVRVKTVGRGRRDRIAEAYLK